MSSASRPASVRARGFTLLEVMCAFAILTLMTGTITVICHDAVETGMRAVDLRELREAADTVFRVALYEDGNSKWQDGQTGTLDYYYGEFAHLRGAAKDRWKAYAMEYHRRAKTAAGSVAAGEAEPLFTSSQNSTRSTSSGGRTGTGTGTTGTGTGTGTSTTGSTTTMGGEPESTGEMVWQITLKIYRTDERASEALLTLQTFLPRQADAGTGAVPAGGTGGAR